MTHCRHPAIDISALLAPAVTGSAQDARRALERPAGAARETVEGPHRNERQVEQVSVIRCDRPFTS